MVVRTQWIRYVGVYFSEFNLADIAENICAILCNAKHSIMSKMRRKRRQVQIKLLKTGLFNSSKFLVTGFVITCILFATIICQNCYTAAALTSTAKCNKLDTGKLLV